MLTVSGVLATRVLHRLMLSFVHQNACSAEAGRAKQGKALGRRHTHCSLKRYPTLLLLSGEFKSCCSLSAAIVSGAQLVSESSRGKLKSQLKSSVPLRLKTC